MSDPSEQSVATQDGQTGESVRRSRRRWVLLAFAACVVLHRIPLAAVGDFLTIDPGPGPHDVALVHSGEHRIDAVAELYAQGRIESIWLVRSRPSYLVSHGLLPPNWQVSRDALLAAGVPPESIKVLNGEADDAADVARIVGGPLAESPQERLLLICCGFECRHLRMVVDDVLAEDLSSRISCWGLPYEEFKMSRWWTSRSGCKEVLSQFCSLGFTLLHGTQPREVPGWMDADAYQRRLNREFGENPCHGL